jgi:hypothetical protein
MNQSHAATYSQFAADWLARSAFITAMAVLVYKAISGQA